MNLELNNKAALITGSTQGLGFASAWALAGEGCRVCICGRDEERLKRASEKLEARAGDSDCILAVQADLTNVEDIAMVVTQTVEKFGGLDVLVNNVGHAGGGGLLDATDQDWQNALDRTLYPAIRTSRLAVPYMKLRGEGVIIMIASIWGRESGGRMTYNAVKAAEISLAKSLAQQLACENIRVNSVAPGSISFPGGTWYRRQQEDPDAMAEFVGQNIPFGRFGRADEVGDVVAFLASARASWVSGATITVDGCQSRSLI